VPLPHPRELDVVFRRASRQLPIGEWVRGRLPLARVRIASLEAGQGKQERGPQLGGRLVVAALEYRFRLASRFGRLEFLEGER
jgi:hypothetical protein